MKIFLAVFTCWAWGHCLAQPVPPVEFQSELTVQTTDGLVKSCGIRLTGTAATPNTGEPRVFVDATISLAGSLGTVRAGSFSEPSIQTDEQRRPTGLNVLWMRVEGEAPLAPAQGSPILGDMISGYHYFTVDLEDTLTILDHVMGEKSFQIAFGHEAKREVVFLGASRVSQTTRVAFSKCLNDMLRDLTK